MNEVIWFIFLIAQFGLTLVFYRLFGKTGLFVWIAFATVIANVQVVKTVELFGLIATLGNITYGTTFLATDILHEKYGKEDAKKGVWLGLLTLVSMTIIMQIVLVFQAHEFDIAHGSLETIFGLQLRVAIGSLIAYFISQHLDVRIYGWFRNRWNSLWIRNNGSTMISQLLDSLIFCTIAFLGVFPFKEWVIIVLSTYLIKWLVALLDTPCLYIAKRMNVKSSI